MTKKPTPERIAVPFDLLELPTAQHRAGLAGLLLQIEAMGRDGDRLDPKLIPTVEDLKPTSVTIAFTRESMQGVFDQLYAAKSVEVVVAAKWPGKSKPKPGAYFVQKKDPKTGEMRQAPGFAYDVVQPQGPALKRHLGDGRDAWLDLWRQMLWSIPRPGKKSRTPFEDRAADRPCGNGSSVWSELVEFDKLKAKSQLRSGRISGTLMLGGQGVNAETIPFTGRVDHNIVLHCHLLGGLKPSPSGEGFSVAWRYNRPP